MMDLVKGLFIGCLLLGFAETNTSRLPESRRCEMGETGRRGFFRQRSFHG